MKQKFYTLTFKTVLVLICTLFTIDTFAQGTISGTIIDAAEGSTLPGAAVMIKGTNYGTITDGFGKYTLTGVPAGTNTIVFSYIGYLVIEKTVELTAGSNLTLNINMEAEAILGQELVVTGQLLGQTKAINQQLNADAIVNMVSEDKIKELPDANAAEAIGRVSGVSLIRNQGEGQKVVIRGLEPRFSAITINGIKVPSNDPNDKSVDLSMISPELLQGIEVFKSPTPDMDAEAVGGSVNLLLNKAGKEPKLKINASGAYNQLRNDYGNYSISGSYNRRFLNNKLGIIAQASTERVNRASDGIDYTYNNFGEKGIETLRPLSVEQQKTNEIRKRSGGSINLDYAFQNGEITLYSLYSTTDRNVSKKLNFYSFFNAEGNYNYNHWEGKSDLFSNMLAGKHTLGIVKTDWSLSYSKTSNNKDIDYNMEFNNPSPFGGKKLDPESPNTWIEESNLDDVASTYLYEMTADQQNILEDNATAALNFEIPFSLGNNWSLSAKFGGKYNILNRTRDDKGSWEKWYYLGVPGRLKSWDNNYPNPYDLDSQNRILLSSYSNPNYTPESFINGTTFNNPIDGGKADLWHDYFKDKFVSNRAVEVDNTDITETILAGYVMGKIKYKNKLTIITGLRMEQSDNEYDSKISSLSGIDNQDGWISDTVTTQKYTEFLPHLHLKYEPIDWFSLRMSMAKTMARPNYNYVSYSAYINNTSSRITTGNPNLKHMTAMNYDVSMAFYTGKYGLLTVGGFYKDMKNIFYRVEGLHMYNDSVATSLGWPGKKSYALTSYENSPESYVYGFEVDLQTSLKFLPKPFNGIVLSANLTRLFSSTTKYTNELIQTDSVIGFDPMFGPTFYVYNKFSSRKITIPGQVPLIVNLSAGYEVNGFSVRISGNYQGAYLISPSQTQSGITDENRNAYWRWDLAMKQKVSRKVEIYASANNLNNMKEESTFGELKNPGKTTITGPMYNLGIRLKL